MQRLEAQVVHAGRSVAAHSELGASWRLSECLRILREAVAELDAYSPPPPVSGAGLAAAATQIRQRQSHSKRTTRPTPGASPQHPHQAPPRPVASSPRIGKATTR
jgi:hypothetical protein